MIDYKAELKKRNQGLDWVAVRLLEISEKTELNGADAVFLQLCAGMIIGTDSKLRALETKLHIVDDPPHD